MERDPVRPVTDVNDPLAIAHLFFMVPVKHQCAIGVDPSELPIRLHPWVAQQSVTTRFRIHQCSRESAKGIACDEHYVTLSVVGQQIHSTVSACDRIFEDYWRSLEPVGHSASGVHQNCTRIPGVIWNNERRIVGATQARVRRNSEGSNGLLRRPCLENAPVYRLCVDALVAPSGSPPDQTVGRGDGRLGSEHTHIHPERCYVGSPLADHGPHRIDENRLRVPPQVETSLGSKRNPAETIEFPRTFAQRNPDCP